MPIEIKPGSGIPIITTLTQPITEATVTETEILPLDLVPESVTQPLQVQWVGQLHSRWCWAASAEMVLRFFEKQVTQCQVAKTHFPDHNCCNTIIGEANCNKALQEQEVADVYKDPFQITTELHNGFVEFEVLQEEINTHQRPVEVGLQWPEGGKHLVIVYACYEKNGVPMLGVNDPFYGQGPAVQYESLKSAYTVNHGSWIRTWIQMKKPGGGNNGPN